MQPWQLHLFVNDTWVIWIHDAGWADALINNFSLLMHVSIRLNLLVLYLCYKILVITLACIRTRYDTWRSFLFQIKILAHVTERNVSRRITQDWTACDRRSNGTDPVMQIFSAVTNMYVLFLTPQQCIRTLDRNTSISHWTRFSNNGIHDMYNTCAEHGRRREHTT
jgi:hypothetical protein